MAGSVNKVILIGNLGRDPESRAMPSGDPIVNLSIATSESWRDKATGARVEKTDLSSVGIAKNDTWTAEIAERLTAAVAKSKVRRAARNLIEHKKVPRPEVAQKLIQRGHDRLVVEAVVFEV